MWALLAAGLSLFAAAWLAVKVLVPPSETQALAFGGLLVGLSVAVIFALAVGVWCNEGRSRTDPRLVCPRCSTTDADSWRAGHRHRHLPTMRLAPCWPTGCLPPLSISAIENHCRLFRLRRNAATDGRHRCDWHVRGLSVLIAYSIGMLAPSILRLCGHRGRVYLAHTRFAGAHSACSLWPHRFDVGSPDHLGTWFSWYWRNCKCGWLWCFQWGRVLYSRLVQRVNLQRPVDDFP